MTDGFQGLDKKNSKAHQISSRKSNYPAGYSMVFIVDIEQENVGWVILKTALGLEKQLSKLRI